MSPRKRNAKAGPSKQPSIESYFSPKPKSGTKSSTKKKRLVQSSLTARPLRSRRPPVVDQDGVLDLTRSTSPPTELESPPSSKKRKLRATTPDQPPARGAPRDPFGSSLSPLSNRSPSPSPVPSPRHKSQITPARLDDKVESMIISPSPVQARSSQSMIPYDPNDIVESSQTQYLHLRFTPQSQRVMTINPGHIPAPVFTPGPEPSGTQGIPGSPHSMDHDQFHIPSSQGEVSEPYTPRKRTRADRSGTPSQIHGPVNAPDITSRSSQELVTKMPRPIRPLSVRTPSKTNPRDRLTSTGASIPRFASPRPVFTPRRQFDRLDLIPSSQGEPSLEPTELGTVESPAKSTKYPGIDTELLPTIPASEPSSQNTQGTPRRGATPLLPISNLDQSLPRTPQREPPPSSPTDIPSPGQLLSSLGLGISRKADQIPPPRLSQATTPAVGVIEKRTLAPGFLATSGPEGTDSPTKNTDEPMQMDRSPAHVNDDSPRRSQSSSQTVIPSSQPMHDSSPPPEYDMDPKAHSFYQGQIQRRSEVVPPDQAPSAFGSRNPSDLRPTSDSNRPYFTARTHHSPMDSSQSLPPSQSPIKGGRMDPDRSAAGVQGVFGMLGFGSDAYSGEGSPMKGAQFAIGEDEESQEAHIPMAYDLPPSSPPPETPAREESRASSPESRSMQSKRKIVVRNPPVCESPLLRAFEAVRNRSKTATPSTRRSLKTYQTTSSPIQATHMDQPSLASSPVRGSQAAKRRSTRAASHGAQASRSVGAGTPSKRPRQVSKTAKPLNDQPNQVSTSRQDQEDVNEEIVESSDAEEAMEVETRHPRPATPNSAQPQTRRGHVDISDKDDVPMEGVEPTTPPRVERLPSSVSPSPIRIRDSPPVQDTRALSPPPESSQTQEESETPWESLRPSQSVSQVFERRLIEEAMEEAERGRRLRMEQDAARQKAKEQEQAHEDESADEQDEQQREETPERPPARPVMISLDPRSPTNVSANPPPQMSLPRTVSTPKSRRVAGKDIYIVTPTKIIKRTPAKVHRDRPVMTPSSLVGEDEEDYEEYTYVDETFNPTESQQNFLNRILQGGSSQIE